MSMKKYTLTFEGHPGSLFGQRSRISSIYVNHDLVELQQQGIFYMLKYCPVFPYDFGNQLPPGLNLMEG